MMTNDLNSEGVCISEFIELYTDTTQYRDK